MDFTSRDNGPRRSPPNYLARSVQRRLLMVVGSLMLVVILMGEARKPQNWEWMWSIGTDRRMAQVDTRIPDKQTSTSDDFRAAVYANRPQQSGFDKTQVEQPDSRAVFRDLAWSHCLDRLDHEQRLTLDRQLKALRTKTPSNDLNRENWDKVLVRLDTEWTRYLEQAEQEVQLSENDVPTAQTDSWRNTIRELKDEWRGPYAAVLRPRLAERQWTDGERATLAGLQSVIDRLDFEKVQDDTVWRGDEQYAWFRLLEQLQELSRAELQQRSAGPASFVQLFRQPDEYRGKLVTVRGRVKLAYQVPAPPNIHGLDSYYIFWLRPAGGQRSPMVVYSLETPVGFPTLNKGNDGSQAAALNEDIVFHAFFFKRWAYRAQDGINTAPLLLAKIPSWHPVRDAASSVEDPSSRFISYAAVAVLVLSIGLAYLAYAVHGRPARQAGGQPWPSDLASSPESDQSLTTNKFLQHLAARHDTQDR